MNGNVATAASDRWRAAGGRAGWGAVLDAPSFVINLDSRPDRLDASVRELAGAGFTDVRRFAAIDATDPSGLAHAWRSCGDPRFAQHDAEFLARPAKQACFLSHVLLWRQVAESGHSLVCVFEDDVYFHRHWHALAPVYFALTPQDWAIVYMGNGIRTPRRPGLVQRIPAVCHHAYMLTADGARRLVSALLESPGGPYTQDMMMYHQQWRAVHDGVPAAYAWYAWNGCPFPDTRARSDADWIHYNTGIVFQDRRFPSDLRD